MLNSKPIEGNDSSDSYEVLKRELKTGVLLVNLGTPKSFKVKDIRSYLDEFLSDPRVIDIPWIQRFLLLKLIILPVRPKRVSAFYEKIWMEDGSPLLVYSEQVKKLLGKELGESYHVELAMRYGEPSIGAALNRMQKLPLASLKVIPLFPQYASASTASVIEKAMKIVKKWENFPSIEFKSYFYNDPDYLNACVEIGKKYDHKKYDHILFSFHGLPERQIKAGDYQSYCTFGGCCETINPKNQFCYRAQCFQTAKSIAEGLGIIQKDYSVSFQSRLGRTPWIKPYTDHVIKEFARKGYKKILVFCPSFVADCLETSYEVSVEYNLLFKSAGGSEIQLVESLNSDPGWINALKNMVIK